MEKREEGKDKGGGIWKEEGGGGEEQRVGGGMGEERASVKEGRGGREEEVGEGRGSWRSQKSPLRVPPLQNRRAATLLPGWLELSL